MFDFRKEVKQKKIEDNELKHNGSGYLDLTGYEAIKKAEHDPRDNPDYERFHKLLGGILRMCELADFRLDGRLEVTDLRTGKTWR